VIDPLRASRVSLLDESGEAVVHDLVAELRSLREEIESLKRQRTTSTRKKKESAPPAVQPTDSLEPLEASTPPTDSADPQVESDP
jgi:hypothetical protein